SGVRDAPLSGWLWSPRYPPFPASSCVSCIDNISLHCYRNAVTLRCTHGKSAMKVCIVGASGKLGQYTVQHALDRGYEVVGVCREQSVAKLDAFTGRITVIPGATDDREVIRKAVAGC